MDMINQLHQYSKDLDVLFVEDDDELRNQMERMFGELFHDVDVADNGKTGLHQYKNRLQKAGRPYDLVITDINMPEMDGIEMIHAIHETDPLQPVIVVSAHNESDYLMELLNIGINSFLIKPVRHQELINTLYKAAKSIINERLVERHYREIEELNTRLSIQSEELARSNEELLEKNIALERSMRIIEGMQHKDRLHRQIDIVVPPSNVVQDNAVHPAVPVFDELSHLEKIENIIRDISQEYSYKRVEDASFKQLSDAVNEYAASLPKEQHYNNLTSALQKLGATLSCRPQCNSVKELERIFNMLESFFFIYTKWQKEWEHIDSNNFKIFSDSIEKEISVLIDVWNCKI